MRVVDFWGIPQDYTSTMSVDKSFDTHQGEKTNRQFLCPHQLYNPHNEVHKHSDRGVGRNPGFTLTLFQKTPSSSNRGTV